MFAKLLRKSFLKTKCEQNCWNLNLTHLRIIFISVILKSTATGVRNIRIHICFRVFGITSHLSHYAHDPLVLSLIILKYCFTKYAFSCFGTSSDARQNDDPLDDFLAVSEPNSSESLPLSWNLLLAYCHCCSSVEA